MTQAESNANLSERKPSVDVRKDGDCLVIGFAGRWTTREITNQDDVLAGLSASGAERARIELGDVSRMDTAGAWLVHRTRRTLAASGVTVDIAGGDSGQMGLIETVAANDAPCPEAPPKLGAILSIVAYTGESTIEIFQECTRMINFLGLTVVTLIHSILHPTTIRLVTVVKTMERTGIHALPIVGLISFLIGVVLAYQGADQLAQFGAQIFTVNLVGYGVLREMGILLTAIIVAGRSGSAFTAQIGTMKVNEEIDALRTIGLDPIQVLVLPRVIALMLVMPLLTFYADMMGLLGGAMMATIDLDISLFQFVRQLNSAVGLWSFWVGMIKAPIFAFIIAMVGCYEGLKVTHSAESVGLRTTSAVVKSIFIVIVLDAFASIMFSILGV